MTRALGDLDASDRDVRDLAVRRLWERFAPRLCALARDRLDPRIRKRQDEDDIVQSMFRSFFEARHAERYSLKSREELWRFLVRLTMCKVANVAHHHRRVRRDVRRERALDSWGGTPGDGDGGAGEYAPFRALSPAEEAISRIELDRICLRLDEEQRQIVGWKLEGYTNADIGRKIGRTERTVELKLRLIRGILVRDPGVSRDLAPASHHGG